MPAKPAWNPWPTPCWTIPTQEPEALAAGYLNEEHKIAAAKDALDGAKQILMERFAENAELLTHAHLWDKAQIRSKLADGKEKDSAKFSDYFDHSEALKDIPSHRAWPCSVAATRASCMSPWCCRKSWKQPSPIPVKPWSPPYPAGAIKAAPPMTGSRK